MIGHPAVYLLMVAGLLGLHQLVGLIWERPERRLSRAVAGLAGAATVGALVAMAPFNAERMLPFWVGGGILAAGLAAAVALARRAD